MNSMIRCALAAGFGMFLSLNGHHFDSSSFWIGITLFMAYGIVCYYYGVKERL